MLGLGEIHVSEVDIGSSVIAEALAHDQIDAAINVSVLSGGIEQGGRIAVRGDRNVRANGKNHVAAALFRSRVVWAGEEEAPEAGLEAGIHVGQNRIDAGTPRNLVMGDVPNLRNRLPWHRKRGRKNRAPQTTAAESE